jgi:hypothetical protein
MKYCPAKNFCKNIMLARISEGVAGSKNEVLQAGAASYNGSF